MFATFPLCPGTGPLIRGEIELFKSGSFSSKPLQWTGLTPVLSVPMSTPIRYRMRLGIGQNGPSPIRYRMRLELFGGATQVV